MDDFRVTITGGSCRGDALDNMGDITASVDSTIVERERARMLVTMAIAGGRSALLDAVLSG